MTNRGVEQFQVIAPPEAKPLIRAAAKLMTRTNDPVEPRAALRQAGGANEPSPAEPFPELLAELAAARVRIEAAEARRIEVEAEAERQRQAVEAERDAAKAAEVTAQEKARMATEDAQKAATATQEAKGQAKKALGRAAKAEAAIQQARSLPGLKGRLVRWLAGDVLE